MNVVLAPSSRPYEPPSIFRSLDAFPLRSVYVLSIRKKTSLSFDLTIAKIELTVKHSAYIFFVSKTHS